MTGWDRLRRLTLVAVAAILLASFGVGVWAGYVQLSGNIHEVEAGRLYRSKQLDADQLGTLLRDKRIRTVLNLRGGTMSDDWYRAEVATIEDAGARLIDLPLADDAEPTPTQLSDLRRILATAPTPLLIHCKAGADRTGLAVALYELLIVHRPADEAAGQLSFAYGHFPWLGSATAAMDRAYWKVAESLPGDAL